MAGDEELGDGHERVEERTDAEDDEQRPCTSSAAGAGRRRDRADRRDGVQRQDEAVPEPVVGRQDEADRAGREQHARSSSPSCPRRRTNATRSSRPRSCGLIVVKRSRRS